MADEIRHRLTPHVVTMSEVRGIGTARVRVAPRSFDDQALRAETAERLAETDDGFLVAFLDDPEHLTSAECVAQIERQLPEGMQGEGTFLSHFRDYRPVVGTS